MSKRHTKKSILIIRITAIGDIVMASPVATALKRKYPGNTITWVVHSKLKPLLVGHPDIDNILTFDADEWGQLWSQRSWLKLWHIVRSFRRELRSYKFDQVIDLQGNLTTGCIAHLSGAQHRIALGPEGLNSWLMTKTISRNLGDQTQIGSEYRYLVNQLGYSDSDWQMFVPSHKHAEQSITTLLKDTLGNTAYAVIVPFAQYPQKNWFEDYWEQIILRIRGRYQLRTVIVGGDNGTAPGERMARLTGAINLAGKTSISETAAILKGAKLIIGVDTGLTHMGHAVNIPTISLFGATYPYAYVENEVSKVIYLDRFCSPCRRKPTCNKQYQCMRKITPDTVLTAIKPIMKKHSINSLRDTSDKNAK